MGSFKTPALDLYGPFYICSFFYFSYNCSLGFFVIGDKSIDTHKSIGGWAGGGRVENTNDFLGRAEWAEL